MRKKPKKSKKLQREGCAVGEASREERAREQAWQSIQHLRVIQNGTHIAELYRTFFPEEFARDTPDYGDTWRLMAYYDRFVRLVNERLFPVCQFSEFDMGYEEPDYCLCHMHLPMIHNWLWANREQYCLPEDLHIVEKLIVSAWEKERVFPDLDFRRPAGHVFQVSLLRVACEEEKGLISRLGLVADAVAGITGNCWLDVSEEEYAMSEHPEWTEEQIRWLAKEYTEAKRLNKGIAEFFRWCDSPGKVERVKRLLRACWVPEGERVKVKAKPGRPLVETLGGLV